MKLAKLHEEFIDSSRRSMRFGRLPIDPREVELPVVPMDKWKLEGDPKHLTKTYRFNRSGDRNSLIRALLDYEEQVQHHALLVLDEDMLQVKLITKGTERVTEIDKEYAHYADQAFKDITSTTGGAHSFGRE